MREQIIYALSGINRQIDGSEESSNWEVTLFNNNDYLYGNNPFIYSTKINDTLTKLTITLNEGVRFRNCFDKVETEICKICFNIAANYEVLSTAAPSWKIEQLYLCDEGNDRIVVETISAYDNIASIIKQEPAQKIYEAAIENKTDVNNNGAQYLELLFILQNPNNAIRFLGLYDILLNLIYSKYNKKFNKPEQFMVVDFFGKNLQRYPYIKFKPSLLNPKKNNDTFTYLRNEIAHSKQVGVMQYIQITQSVSYDYIRKILQVINDLLCGEVQP